MGGEGLSPPVLFRLGPAEVTATVLYSVIASGVLIAHRTVRNDLLVDDPAKSINLADPDVAALVGHLIEAARRLGRSVE